MPGPVQFSFRNAEQPAPGAIQVGFEGEGEGEGGGSGPVPQVVRVPPKNKPKNIVQLAKARLREAKRELRRMKAVEREVAELERLIAAAEGPKVRSNVRTIGVAK